MHRLGFWIFTSIATALATGCSGGEDGEPDELTLLDAPAAEVDAAPEAQDVPAGAPTVVFLGDSLGAGLHLAEHQAFPAVLQRALADERPFHLVNASESGRTTSGGVTALDWVMQREPDLVVIELGANDGLRGIPIADVESNLRALVQRAREGDADVLLLGMRMPPNYGDYGAEFDALYPRLADELKVPFVPAFLQGVGGEPEMNLPDGIHPTAAGHEKLAENVTPALREALGRLAP
ncbi:MAG: arylesterase [Planctomycetota bacterium]